MIDFYDVIILGGGVAGSSCGMALSRLGIRNVLILDAGKDDSFKIGESIPPVANQLLKYLGVYSDFLNQGHLPCFGSCSYWGNELRGYNDTVLSPAGNGWHLDRGKFDAFLLEKASDSGVKVIYKANFVSSEILDNGYSLRYKKGDQLHQVFAKVVVDATGKKSVWAKSQGAKQIQDKPLYCLSKRFKLSEEDKASNLTEIEAVEDGWWYGAKLPDNEFLAAFYTTKELIRLKGLQDECKWSEGLRKTKRIKNSILNALPVDSVPQGWIAPSFKLDRISDRNWLAIGDAASSYDPITSRGIFKAIDDAIFSAELIARKASGQEDALEEMNKYVNMNYARYIDERFMYYSLEKRWESSDFWMGINSQEVFS
ncbi:NAD(P)/FAD-dependent oxidoreductase [Aureibacter tunicatorum]|uniref:Flavin-dependent dehydrogenase n=1 Tax=Aureibacter tunicatorum TaxID=866807 RepID=A0AAE3XJ93_9BACT|nr:NAD(P)/FAD-dependent oxidoreductase [Aureibacter tunicatorum]MDR6237382.1 flavin-dependent dehydrogenase [Aureibacter tunicatorum]BDD06372.1 hypothetical protein AUTU_38550 [Aureibacter tunicatorum]